MRLALAVFQDRLQPVDMPLGERGQRDVGLSGVIAVNERMGPVLAVAGLWFGGAEKNGGETAPAGPVQTSTFSWRIRRSGSRQVYSTGRRYWPPSTKISPCLESASALP